MTDSHHTERHKPVLLHEILTLFDLKPGAIVVDCNLGDGGHSEVIIKKLHGEVSILGFDLDADAIARTKRYLAESFDADGAPTAMYLNRLIPIQANFSTIDTALKTHGVEKGTVDAILFDLGLSTYDLIGSGKGFTFRSDESLEMTFGQAADYPFTAADIVNGWAEEDIANVIYAYGEETAARKIARAIVEARAIHPITTSGRLAEIIEHAVRWKKYGAFGRPKTHPATKTFQALRIAVNNELEHLRIALPKALEMLKPGGVMAVISYHSLEDRIVKHEFKAWAEGKDGENEEGEGGYGDRDRGLHDAQDMGQPRNLIELLTKKPIVPTEEEEKENPRSRSAKLRAIRKL